MNNITKYILEYFTGYTQSGEIQPCDVNRVRLVLVCENEVPEKVLAEYSDGSVVVISIDSLVGFRYKIKRE